MIPKRKQPVDTYVCVNSKQIKKRKTSVSDEARRCEVESVGGAWGGRAHWADLVDQSKDGSYLHSTLNSTLHRLSPIYCFHSFFLLSHRSSRKCALSEFGAFGFCAAYRAWIFNVCFFLFFFYYRCLNFFRSFCVCFRYCRTYLWILTSDRLFRWFHCWRIVLDTARMICLLKILIGVCGRSERDWIE